MTTAFPARATIAGTPDNATAQGWFATLWDAITGLIGSGGGLAEARSQLGVDVPTIIPSVAGSALTLTLKTASGNVPSTGVPLPIAFRSATLSSGALNIRQATAATSVVVSSGSTLGSTDGVDNLLYVYFIDNAGTVELGISSANFGTDFIGSSTAEGGAGAADDPGVIYSTTARTNVAMKLAAILRSNQTTSGTWAAVPTEVRYPGAADQHVDRSAWKMVTGRYYNAPFNANLSGASVSVVAGTVYLVPYVQAETRSMAALSLSVSTTGAGSIRAGLYSDNAGLPGSLIASLTPISCSTTGIKEYTFGKVLPAGNYWLAIQSDVAPAVVGITFYGGGSLPAVNGCPSIVLGTSCFGGYSKSQAYASGLPANIASPTELSLGTQLGLYMKA